jgi:hypothetical protein
VQHLVHHVTVGDRQVDDAGLVLQEQCDRHGQLAGGGHVDLAARVPVPPDRSGGPVAQHDPDHAGPVLQVPFHGRYPPPHGAREPGRVPGQGGACVVWAGSAATGVGCPSGPPAAGLADGGLSAPQPASAATASAA